MASTETGSPSGASSRNTQALYLGVLDLAGLIILAFAKTLSVFILAMHCPITDLMCMV